MLGINPGFLSGIGAPGFYKGVFGAVRLDYGSGWVVSWVYLGDTSYKYLGGP